ncbi:MAG TPA: DUF4935 domain-containing protein [Thermoplasmata archaeon]|nr:DUF4935 domain-containing protein [Thermoplasmata archaeon]
MDCRDKTLVILDTNKIRSNFEWESDYSNFEPKGDLLKLIDFIEKHNLQEVLFLGIPDIVLKEVINARCDNFKKQVNRIKSDMKKLETMPCCDFSQVGLPEEDFDYREFIKKKIDDFISSKKFILILELKKELYAEVLELLIEKATQKKKPFNEHGRGFKDALIWETILNFEDINSYSSVFVLSENKKDFDYGLKEEFKKKFSKELDFEANTDALIASLENIYGLYIRYPAVLSHLKTDYFEDQLKQYLTDNTDIKIGDFKIKDIQRIDDIIDQDIEDFELKELYGENNFENLKKITIIFENDNIEYNSEIIFDPTINEIVTLTYNEREEKYEGN